MKLNIEYIYGVLLFISIISSSALFVLLVAETTAESTSNSIKYPEEINTEKGVNSNQFSEGPSETQNSPETIYEGPPSSEHSITEEIVSDNTLIESFKPLENDNQIFEAALSQNSGVLDGIVEPDQVIFTLVDTASLELQKTIENSLSNEIKNDSIIPLISVQKDSEFNVSTDDDSRNNESSNKVELLNISDSIIVDDKKDSEILLPEIITEVPEIVNIIEEESDEQLKNDTLKQVEKQPQYDVKEDIPLFSEWAQKQLEEAEKKKDLINASAQNQQKTVKTTSNMKIRSKNYASPDCGAKIIAANSEASNAGAVLSSSSDEYMLNTCTSKIWFVIEMCESIQAKKIELANFELFSSSPKDFLVSISDRFPTRDWSAVGQFTAQDERNIQNFNLNPYLFGKYIKVELQSHYGSEHFCPISLFHVYGTSEFEVLETEERVQTTQETEDDDDEFDEPINIGTGEPSTNLFGTARDAVISLVKKAAQALGTAGDKGNNTNQRKISCNLTNTANTEGCQTPSHIIVCDNCSDLFFGNVYELLSCQNKILNNLGNMQTISKAIFNGDVCVDYGLKFNPKATSDSTRYATNILKSFFTPEYVAALCNILAIREKKVVLNTSLSLFTNLTDENNISSYNINDSISTESEIKIPTPTVSFITEKQSPIVSTKIDDTIDVNLSSDNNTSQVESLETIKIQPTETYKEENENRNSTVDFVFVTNTFIQSSESDTILHSSVHAPSTESVQPTALNSSKVSENLTQTEDTKESSSGAKAPILVDNNTESGENFDIPSEPFDPFFPDLDHDSISNPVVTTSVTPQNSASKQAQKESVFIRLHNRIKALEKNMSLSSQYLEELSRSYKKQMEEMQRAFEKTLVSMSEESKKSEEFRKQTSQEYRRIEEQLLKLSLAVDILMSERNSWTNILSSWSINYLIPQLVVVFLIIYFCVKTDNKYFEEPVAEVPDQIVIPARRISVDVIGHDSPIVTRKRRPSEEALLNITGTYEDLLISENTENDGGSGTSSKGDKRRKRKKSSNLRRSSSNTNLSSESNKSNGNGVKMNKKTSLDMQIGTEPVSRVCETSIVSLNSYIQTSPFESTSEVSEEIQNVITTQPFIKTAMSERNKRMSVVDNEHESEILATKNSKKLIKDTEKEKTDTSLNKNTVFLNRSMSLNESDITKKEKKQGGGLKKILKKVF